MKIQTQMPLQTLPRSTSPTASSAPQPTINDSYSREEWQAWREKNQQDYLNVFRGMAGGAVAGGLVGAGVGLLPLPAGFTVGLLAGAGAVTGAWLGVAVGYGLSFRS